MSDEQRIKDKLEFFMDEKIEVHVKLKLTEEQINRIKENPYSKNTGNFLNGFIEKELKPGVYKFIDRKLTKGVYLFLKDVYEVEPMKEDDEGGDV